MSQETKGEALPAQALTRVPLEEMNLYQLQATYLAAFKVATPSRNLPYLRRKIAQRQSLPQGEATSPSLEETEATASHLEEQPGESEFQPNPAMTTDPEPSPAPQASKRALASKGERDPRLPAIGAMISRTYKETAYEVEVLEKGFRCQGHPYRSLSALASELTGHPTNGFLFFGLTAKEVPDAR